MPASAYELASRERHVAVHPARVIVRCRGDALDAKLVALTFDDGPGDWTGAILDLLAAHGARATFFVLGHSIAGREDVLRRTVADGHELGNHTFGHHHPLELSDAALREELRLTSERIADVTGVPPRLARPPYGEDAERFAQIAAELELSPTVLWSVDPLDWQEPPSQTVARRTLDAIHPGAIVDLHDGFRIRGDVERSRQPTAEAVARIIPALHERGYELVTVSELLSRR
ncbi:MAG: polysaccharide deacetylase family protein [Actinomycetota bacterium]|nr:polysaccharide deacetylase family protein [Actinomycetota bacterium]